jgi:Fe-S-cluster-containing dehydrogenase component
VTCDRRTALRALAGAGAALGTGAAPALARERERRKPPADAVGMLYDTTLCIGCKACVVACREANGLPPATSSDGLHDAPLDLDERTKNVIKLYKEGARLSYVKRQCMHCVDPACVGACMIGALQKRQNGIVTWDGGRCIGCRYCQEVCSFEVPKFEWSSATPRIVKCELCAHRLAVGKLPGCVEVCPRKAVIYGTRAELLDEAHRRLAEHPDRYVPHVYGEDDGGGTQVLYVSHVPFEKIGLPDLGKDGVPKVQQTVQHGMYQGFVAPVALYAVLGGVMFRNRTAKRTGTETETETGTARETGAEKRS